MKMEDKIAKGKKYIMNTYGRLPVVLEKGEGSWVFDMDGNKYLDFVAGIAVNSLGHNSQVINKALKEQSEKLIHCSNLYWIEPQIDLAEVLCSVADMDKAFFCNSGAEANEAAIKLARKWGSGRYEIISAIQSFHGRTMGALAATGQEKYQKSFIPVLTGFKYAVFNDLKSVEDQITEKTCAIMLEPIQGEGGINEPSEEFFKGVKELCQKHSLLLIIDEVQTGIGRTGRAFGFQNYNFQPDIITLAKGLGGGVPIGAMLAKDEVAEIFQPGDHASTFGGNPLVTNVALNVCKVVFHEDFLKEVQEKGKYMSDKLKDLKERFSFPGKVKGKGLMIGMDYPGDAGEIVNKMLEKNILINAIGGKTLRFVPPLNVKYDEIDIVKRALEEVFEEVSA
jgi:predicted acetylornithine/succinylornithine family transaminase